MVMGVKAKIRRRGSVQVDYQILVQEIKPWPPSESLKSLRSVFIQWENGDRHSGSTSQVVPTIGIVIGEGKIEFNEPFQLPVNLVRDMSTKNRDSDTFQRNCLEFNLYEPRRDKTAKGQLLASAMIDLAEYGIVRESLSITVPMNCKRTFRKTDQPVLSLKIQPSEKGRNGSSLRDTLSRMSLDGIGGESVSAFVNEEYAEEHEGVSSADDDVSSHSSMSISSSALNSSRTLPSHIEENGPGIVTHSMEGGKKEHILVSKSVPDKSVIPENGVHRNQKGSSSFSSSIDLSSDPGSPANGRAFISSSTNSGSVRITQNGPSNRSVSHSALLNEKLVDETHITAHEIHENNANDMVSQVEAETTPDIYNRSMEAEDVKIICESRDDRQCLEEKNHCSDDEAYDTQNAEEKQVSPGSDYLRMESNVLGINKLKHVKSVRSPVESVRSNGSTMAYRSTEAKEVIPLGDAHNCAGTLGANERKDTKMYPKDTKSAILNGKVQKLQHRIQMLEAELREAAAIEAALYSVVAEHGSSMSKVHAPARRLSRLYLHSWKEHSLPQRASAARSAVSGLVLIAKACGNDVPRLTFWLSNSIVLRTITSQATGDLEQRPSAGPHVERNGGNKESSKMLSPLKWKASSPTLKEDKHTMYESFGNWEDPHTFTSALGKVETWIFSRIIELIWWQTLTPHMQSAAAKAIDKALCPGSGKNLRRASSSTDQEQGNFSLDLWKKAFRDSCERICPLRAGGHECGCLPVLARLVMEQCVARLDVAMFNAILRESADEIPTDPVSDPISDPKVIPIPAGKSSFGAGAQLKNTIGNWSRWLADLFGIDDDQNEDENEDDHRQDTTCKSFHLLNALSDLMMLPKDLLLSRSVRKEVCPTFGAPLIKRILENFVPDEFCPDPIPYVVLEALNSEEPLEAGEESIMNFPCSAAPIVYLPPSVASIFEIIGKVGSQSELRKCGSSLLRKSYTSDDELDELNSPLASILINSPQSMSAAPSKPSWISEENRNQRAIRYELLRDIWLNSA